MLRTFACACLNVSTASLRASQGGARGGPNGRPTDADGSWHYRVVESGGMVRLSSGAALSVEAIYEGAYDVPGDAPRPADARTGDDL